MAKICLENVSLEYPVYHEHGTSLRHKLINITTGGNIAKTTNNITVVQALSSINITISAGDRLGIMGHNGSGKTTLLRCMAGIYAPTSGRVTREGSFSPLIEIGAGLEPELSGVDNIRRLLYIQGFERCDIPRIIQGIENFSELGEFLSLPVRTYSSGMMMRLMFAVATAETPDILIMDEFFSVGDEGFRDKAEKRLKENIENTSILIFASHNELLLKSMCNRFVNLSHGKLEEINL